MKRIIFYMLFLTSLMFVGCADMGAKLIVDENANIENLIETVDFQMQNIKEINNTNNMYDLTLSDILKKYNISFLKRTTSGEYYTAWLNKKDNTVIFVSFEKKSKEYHVLEIWECSINCTEEIIKKIIIGETTLSDINLMFKNFDYYDGKQTGIGRLALIHMLDGSILSLEFDQNLTVENITYDEQSAIISPNDINSLIDLLNNK